MRYDVILAEVFPEFEKAVFQEFRVLTRLRNYYLPGETWQHFSSRPCAVSLGLGPRRPRLTMIDRRGLRLQAGVTGCFFSRGSSHPA